MRLSDAVGSSLPAPLGCYTTPCETQLYDDRFGKRGVAVVGRGPWSVVMYRHLGRKFDGSLVLWAREKRVFADVQQIAAALVMSDNLVVIQNWVSRGVAGWLLYTHWEFVQSPSCLEQARGRAARDSYQRSQIVAMEQIGWLLSVECSGIVIIRDYHYLCQLQRSDHNRQA